MPKLIFHLARFVPETQKAFLDNGITTVREVGSGYGCVIKLRQQLRNGDLEGPSLSAAGSVFTTPGAFTLAVISHFSFK
ncbi:MAG: hypothetical protein ACPK85_09545 [Methanosarcina sp.]